MITKNGMTVLATSIYGGNYIKNLTDITNSSKHCNTACGMKLLTNTKNQECNSNNCISTEEKLDYASMIGTCILTGKGTSAPSADDYKLSEVISTLTPISCNAISMVNVDNGIYGFTETFVNNTEENITVKEIGLYLYGPHDPGQYATFLLAREVLDTPVTIKSGEMYTATMLIG